MHHAYRLSPVKNASRQFFKKNISRKERECVGAAPRHAHTRGKHTHIHTHCKRREKDEKERAIAGDNILSPAKLYYRPQVERDKERKMTREKKTEIGFKS